MNIVRIKVLGFFGSLLLVSLVYEVWPAAIVSGFFIVLGYFTTSKESNKEWEDQIAHGGADLEEHCYYGDELKLSTEKIVTILNKYFPYFSSLTPRQKDKFLIRLSEFIKAKTFKTHDTRGFNEMPVLISATAIQFSFGLQQYLLPHFEFIHFYPEEFLNTKNPNVFLEGDVSGRSINISWKHFLTGFYYPDNGRNVGLHEIAHAYFAQNFTSKKDVDKDFVSAFSSYSVVANKVFDLEKKPGNDFFSDYALRSFQEFWAASVEVFFETPAAMNLAYPELYSSLSMLLNQDPLTHPNINAPSEPR